MSNYYEIIYEEYDNDIEEYEGLINDDIMPSRRWKMADKLRHRDSRWELEYDEFTEGKWYVI